MRPEPDDLQLFMSQCRTMDIEELEASIYRWDKWIGCPTQNKSLDIAKKELELKYKERQEQIRLLTKSLTSSSRICRWISSVAAVIKQIKYFNN